MVAIEPDPLTEWSRFAAAISRPFFCAHRILRNDNVINKLFTTNTIIVIITTNYTHRVSAALKIVQVKGEK